MTPAPLAPETLHASCVAIDGRGVLLAGRSGSGKSDLALRLIDRGAKLVSDDYTLIWRDGDRLLARAPNTIAGKIEIRGIGLIDLPAVTDIPVCLMADLDGEVERLPEVKTALTMKGLAVPVIAIRALEPSAPVKLEIALLQFGLKFS